MTSELTRQATWHEELTRQARVEKWVDYYYNRQVEHVESRLKKTHPMTWQTLTEHIETNNLVEQIANKSALLFQQDPAITIEKPDVIQEKFAGMLAGAGFVPKMSQINKLQKAIIQVCAIPFYDEKDNLVDIRIVTPDKIFVMQDPNNPTRIAELYYCIGIMENSPNVADAVNHYVKWTDEYYQEGTVLANGSFTPHGEPVDNIYGEIPVVIFQTEEPLDTVWSTRANYLVEKNELINIKSIYPP